MLQNKTFELIYVYMVYTYIYNINKNNRHAHWKLHNAHTLLNDHTLHTMQKETS